MIFELDLSPRQADILIVTLAMANDEAIGDEIDAHPDEVKETIISARTRLENQR